MYTLYVTQTSSVTLNEEDYLKFLYSESMATAVNFLNVHCGVKRSSAVILAAKEFKGKI